MPSVIYKIIFVLGARVIGVTLGAPFASPCGDTARHFLNQ